MKTNIIGSSGSGKTTLAKNLARNNTNIILHLDDIVYLDKEKQIKNSVEEFQKILDKWLNKDEWIIEGVFPFEEIFKKSR